MVLAGHRVLGVAVIRGHLDDAQDADEPARPGRTPHPHLGADPVSDVHIPAAQGPLPVYVAAPPGNGPWPGVVLVHDFTGMSQDLRHQTEWLAGAGFLAAAPDLFHWAAG